MISAGRLNHSVSIQQPIETQNEYGEAVVMWGDLSTGIWASIEPIRGTEYWRAQQVQAEVDTRIVIRYSSGITHKMRVLNNSDEYYIRNIIDTDERHTELHLMCARFPE
jgi:SPP1 family predicted phage head-tail adaptor